MEKQVKVSGSVGDSKWGKQYKQQHRVIESKQCGYAIASAINVNQVVKKWQGKKN